MVTVGPVLLIGLVAIFSSPDYAFLFEKWDVLLGALGYASLNVLVLSMIALGISSLASRKSYALAGVFAFILGSDSLGAMLAAGAPLPDALRIANEAAGVVVAKLGTAVVLPEELA